MTVKELREKPDEQLDAALLERRRHLFELRSQAVTEKLEDPTQMRKVRLDIARVKTIQRQRALEKDRQSQPQQA
jgi:large subunit ribosomal protein L29